MKVTIIAGARPNFVKVAPLIHAIFNSNTHGNPIIYRLVHTGQHYDRKMSESFFEELNIPFPDVNLGCGGGSQAEQTAAIMTAFEKELAENPCDLVIVVGDVTSTMACTITAKKMNTKVAHIEAGIRSYDLTMPEEINRMVTDSIADYFFTTTQWASDNLRRCGIEESHIFKVGNIMIDTLLANINRLKKPTEYDKIPLQAGNYFVLTMHRPANVDETEHLTTMLKEITSGVHGLPVVFPIHPRTASMLSKKVFKADNLFIIEPLEYLEFNYLVKHAKAVITDSGGITEETTVMGVPCFTLRNNTERPETCTIGTNLLVGTDSKKIKPALDKLFSGQWQKGSIPELWDGHTATRIVDILLSL
jgi:UDP-N-acetylglucosamine 2-epimerase (non-hydrolysing)